ncbi:MAG: PH domain-containing protein [Candidatus Andersenbacteria bacterium]
MSLRDYFTQSLKKDEAIVAIVRKHWITLLVPLVLSVVVLGLLIGFVDFFFRNSAAMVAWFVLLFGTLLYGIYHWVIHYFDSLIVTDQRIIDIDQSGLFKRTVSETTFDKVQDVTYSIVGLVATSLDYGAVSVQTAGADKRLELDHVPHPRKVHEILMEAQKLFKERHGGDMSAKELIELIARAHTTDEVEPSGSDSGEAGESEEAE